MESFNDFLIYTLKGYPDSWSKIYPDIDYGKVSSLLLQKDMEFSSG